MILNPFDVVKVSHIQGSVSYGVIEEISHITDTANFLADYVSNKNIVLLKYLLFA